MPQEEAEGRERMRTVGILMILGFFVGLFLLLGVQSGYREVALVFGVAAVVAVWIVVGAFLAVGRLK